ncbi:hypothetical protein H310_00702 [Aphanomyces invadans]|uniref:E3 ubiquitin-protein ligase HACE1 n=1 Tax=Aphanomyces invadans TaxID=157072 RepID=A0A024UVL5_9STRA|nr:hypothetical protein H310_00702 [Aphanomyces invadans]ETW10384.1 hypothetical protein H310_00702 [Aphanomyces invadans]|eukprot:XP_008861795.1 hypothetical protein H310_00702 [Aphanomyces invadans]
MNGTNEGHDVSERGGRHGNNRGRSRGGRGRHGKGGTDGGNTTPASSPVSTRHQQPKNLAAQLASAVASLSLDTVKNLLETDRSLVNHMYRRGETLLTLVCGLKSVSSPEIHTSIVETLFAHGALLSVKNKQGCAAFTLACSRHHVHLLPLLLHEAVKQEQVNPHETVPALLLATLGGLDERATDSNSGRWEAIQLDPERCHQTVTFLLEQTKALQNGDAFVHHAVRAATPRGVTPLHLAAGLFLPKTVAYLLENHGDPHVHEDNSLTPVQFLDKCFCHIESFLIDDTTTAPSEVPDSTRTASTRGSSQQHGRGKRANYRRRAMSTIGTSVQARALKTVQVFAKHCGLEPLFANNGCFSLRSRRLKNVIVAHVGLASILETTCAAKDSTNDSKLVLLHYVAGLYRAMHKNHDLRTYWEAAMDRSGTDDDLDHTSSTHPFTPKTLEWLVHRLTEGNPNPRFRSTWAYIVAHVLKLYAPAPRRQISDLKVYTTITASMAVSVKRLVFNLCDADSSDDEFEIKSLFAKVEMLVLWLIPYVSSLAGDIDPVQDVLKVVTEPLHDLKYVVQMALQVMPDDVYAPDRFAAALYVLQLVAQLETCFESKQIRRVHHMLRGQLEKPHARTWRNADESNVPVSLSRFSSAFGLPESFVQWMMPLRDQVNLLIRSEVRLLAEYFQDWSSNSWFITTANKLEYIEAMADERHGRFQLTINRQASTLCFLDFVIQQVLCTSMRNLNGEMEINFLNEPGLGVGPLREFFELVAHHFFNPQVSIPSDERDHHGLASTSSKSIFSQWLHMARQNISATKIPSTPSPAKQVASSPLKKNHSSALWLPIFSFADSNRTSLCFQSHPLPVACAPILEQDGVYHIPFDRIVENADLAKVYRCAGRLMGLALRHQAPLGVRLPNALWKFVRGADKLTWQDYTAHNPQFQAGLAAILNHDFGHSTDDNDSEWELYFEACGAVVVVVGESDVETEVHYPTTEIELVPGGKTIRVTNDNKAEYVQLRAERFFCNQMANLQAFQKGVLDVVYKRDLLWLSAEELQSVALGELVVDVAALQKHIHYARPAHSQHPTIVHFWAVVHAMDQSTLRQLLTFWSGSSQPPLFGFDFTGGNSWSIKLTSRDNVVHWPCPQAITCEHQLLLPEYPSEEVLREKFMVALKYGSLGFDRV